jgi:hypothetical protein
VSRYRVLVLGPSRHLAASLEPFSEEVQVGEYFLPVEQWVLDHASKSLPDPHDSPALVRKLSKMLGTPVVFKDGLWGHNSTYNPEARWESWSVVPLPCRPDATPVSTLCKGDLDVASWVKWRAWDGEESMDSSSLGDYWPTSDIQSLFQDPAGSSIEIPDLGARAVLGEGVWREPGQVGWFGTSTATVASATSYWEWYSRFWASLPKEAEITLVECDI